MNTTQFQPVDLIDTTPTEDSSDIVRITISQARVLTLSPTNRLVDMFDLFHYQIPIVFDDGSVGTEDYLEVPRSVLYSVLNAHPELGPRRWEWLA